MHNTRWQKLQDLFHEAAELPERQRRVFLTARCADDPALADEVMAMLAEDARGSSLLDGNVAEVASAVLDDANAASLPQKSFGPYRILTVLGEGGMGIVYLAEREDLGSQVAIKILRDAWLSAGRRTLFDVEQRTLARLNHPAIARLYDADISPDGTPYFVMEYVQGVPLTDYCVQHRTPLRERLRLFRSVCEAVQHAHQHAVIHRDLKPTNVLVKEDGSVRLLDFGIAKQLENLGDSANQTQTSLRLLTPAYAAPEQVLGGQVGIRTDVYSLGVILYELLAGRLPFDLSNRTPVQVERLLIGQPVEKPSNAAAQNAAATDSRRDPVLASKSVWADLDVLCLTAMHRDVTQRYGSVEALIRDVDHYLRGEPLEAQADTWWYRTRKFVARNRASVAAALVVFALTVSLIAFFTVRLTKARNAAVAEAVRTQRIQQFMASLFQGGDATAGPADSLRVVTLLDRGAQEAQSLDGQPTVQADLYETLGTLYQRLGKLTQADSLLRAAFEKHRSLYGAQSPEAARSLVALGLLRSEQGRLDEAQALTHQGMEINERLLPPASPAIARSMVAFGKVLAERGSYDQAYQTLNEAVRLNSSAGAAPLDLAASLAALADAQYSGGHYAAADALYRRVLAMDRQLHGPRHPTVARDLGNLGSIQQDLGYYGDAERFERQALEITEGYYGRDHPKTANSLTMLGRALIYEKKYDQGQEALQSALAIEEHVFGPMHPAVADTLNELGNIASSLDDYDQAEARFQRVADIYRKVYGDHHYLVAIALSNVAYVYLNRKDYDKAEQLFRDVVRRFTETLSANNVNTGIARIKLGRTLLREQRFADARTETLAGYENLMKQANPGVSFLQAARKDLAADYDAMGDPQTADRYRAELATAQTDSATKPAGR